MSNSKGAKPASRDDMWLWMLFVASTLEILTVSLTLPSMPKLMAEIGIPFQRQTQITSVLSLVTFLTTPILGRLSDKFGRTVLMRLSSLGQFAVNLLLARVTSWEAVALVRVSGGLSRCFTPVSYAYISDHTTPQHRGRAMGVFGTSFGVAFFIGPVLGGIIEKHYDVRRPFLVAALLGLANAYLIGFLPEAKKTSKEGGEKGADRTNSSQHGVLTKVLCLLRDDPRLGCLLLGRFVLQSSQVLFESTFSQFIMVILKGDSSLRGRIMGVVGLLGILANGILVRSFGNMLETPMALAASMAITALGHVFWGMSSSSVQMSLALVPLVLTSAAIATVTKGLISKSCSPDIMGFVMGLSGSLDSSSRIFFPPLAGYIFETVSPRAVGFVCAGGALIAALLFLMMIVMPSQAGKQKDDDKDK